MTMIVHEIFALLIPQVLTPIPLSSFYLTLLAELVIWMAARRMNHLFTIQTLAVVTFLAPLFLLFKYQATNVSYYLIIVFVMGFLMPWNAVESAWVVTLPLLAYLGAHVAARDLNNMADEIFVLFVSFAIIFGLQLMQEQDRQQRFAAEHEAELTRLELMDSLRIAARLHADLISDSRDYGPVRARVHYEPMQQLGGDFVRIEPLDTHRTAMLIGDVTGHGAPAALMVNRINSQVETILMRRSRPREAAETLNSYITSTFEGSCIYMTATWIEYDAQDHMLRWCNFGHPPAFHISARTREVRRLEGGVRPMGIDAEITGTETATPVTPGDVIVCYTDGLIEMQTRTGPFGIDGLQAYLRKGSGVSLAALSADDVISRLARAVRSGRQGEAQDDLLMIAWEILA